jgi:hypothetical protein
MGQKKSSDRANKTAGPAGKTSGPAGISAELLGFARKEQTKPPRELRFAPSLLNGPSAGNMGEDTAHVITRF